MTRPRSERPIRQTLSGDGFVIELIQNESGLGAGKRLAASAFSRLRSHAAAEAYARFTFSESDQPGPVHGTAASTRFVRFAVPGVAGAQGVAEIARYTTSSDANVQWVEGSCLLQLTDVAPSSTPLARPLIKAAQAVSRRTRGSCTTRTPHGFPASGPAGPSAARARRIWIPACCADRAARPPPGAAMLL